MAGPGALPQPPEEYTNRWANELVSQLHRIHTLLDRPAQIGYAVTNPTTKRDLDVSAATLADVAQTLGTLIQDLKDRGMLG